MTPDVDNDGLPDALAAVRAYLAELDAYRSAVLRCEPWATVRDRKDGLRVRQDVALADGAAESLRAAVRRLPGWDETVWWPSERKLWKSLLYRERAEARVASRRLAMLRGVSWNGRPVLASAWADGDSRLAVELILPPLPSDLPELPLRRVALALRCHEHLLPTSVTPPLTPPVPLAGGHLTVRGYLSRAMPKNTAASQCIFGGGAG
jgi:hypothetical protein